MSLGPCFRHRWSQFSGGCMLSDRRINSNWKQIFRWKKRSPNFENPFFKMRTWRSENNSQVSKVTTPITCLPRHLLDSGSNPVASGPMVPLGRRRERQRPNHKYAAFLPSCIEKGLKFILGPFEPPTYPEECRWWTTSTGSTTKSSIPTRSK